MKKGRCGVSPTGLIHRDVPLICDGSILHDP